ncbi:trypsin-like peptidase domain-containing protein [Kitasatospora sp. YST-16]|uniref:VMAP-C domain-containing protein n=1 Tax=Kitasatospora sp. YST-16 TaxID=2998080 RepID=UPI002283C0BD|nr:trypsin-like peptidase domain-containing protein [Kitasatospora sp. YST-16]WAL73364.1 trypsin-like peptidase domain-containing protein [Kitasatospora sp. YST-16]WNW39420.1 trypsin-like peptidase domain-containing protein [Streptomyces sp. Li-HN-5-13]
MDTRWQPGPQPGEDLDAAAKAVHVSVYREGDPRAFGGGLLLPGGRVLTCAHVVNQALDRHPHEQSGPGERDGAVDGLQFGLPNLAPGRRWRAALEHWLPPGHGTGRPARADDREWTADLALLALLGPLPEPARPVPLGHHRIGPSAFAWFGSGNASTVAAVTVQGVTDHWLVLDTPGSAQGLVEGYSGSPLWDREQRRMVGLVVGRRDRRAFAIPTRVIVGHFPQLADTDATGSAPAGEPVQAWPQLVDAVRRTLPDAAHRVGPARQLARELGAAQPPDDAPPEWFAHTALTADHGTATLLALLADLAATPRQRLDLQTEAVYAAPDELLTAAEHRELLALLAHRPDRPGGVAARALPLLPLPDDADWPALVGFLEGHRSRQGRVPALLRTVEFAAQDADPPALGTALRAWSDAVAERLGVAAGLVEHRAQAAEAAAARSQDGDGAPLVQVQLWRSGRTGLFGWTLEAAAADGTVFHRSTQDAPAAREDLLAQLADLLARTARESPAGALPRIEFFVPRDELNLDVDQWVHRPDPLFPGVLGEDFMVVLRCPELRRPEYLPELRYRWQTRHSAQVLALDRRDPAVQERGRPRPIGGVTLCCPPADADVLRAIAMAVGVPGVVWARPAAARDAPARLRALTDGLTPAQLPRMVYRTRVGQDDDALGRHLALVYDGPDGIPAALPLADPA